MADNSLTPKEEFLLNPVTEHNITDAAIATFETNLRHPVKVEIPFEPAQDLHGYDHPWPGGGSINLLPTAESKTQNGISFSVQNDGSIAISGTATAIASIDIGRGKFILPTGIYRYDYNAGTISGVSTSVWADGSPATNLLTGTGPFTVNNESSVFVRIAITPGAAVNFTAYPMIKAGETAADYVPYSNECPISGWTGAEIEQTGKNLLSYSINRLSGRASDVTFDKMMAMFLRAGQTYTLSFDMQNATSWRIAIVAFDVAGNRLWREQKLFGSEFSSNTSGSYYIWPDNKSTKTAIISPVYDCYAMLFFSLGDTSESTVMTDQMLELGSAATAYAPYTGNQISVNWQTKAGTVYGSTLTLNPDRTGTLVVERAIVDLGTLAWIVSNKSIGQYYSETNFGAKQSSNIICTSFKYGNAYSGTEDNTIELRIGTYYRTWIKSSVYSGLGSSEFKNAMSGVILCYELNSPQTYQLTASEVSGILTALYGTNNIWSNIGNVNVKYLTQNSDTGMEYRGDRALELRRRAMLADAPTIYTAVGSSATGGLASFKSYIKAPVKKIEIPFSPVQDLHGYDHPWPAGGGKNLFNKDVYSARNLRTNTSTGGGYSAPGYTISAYIPVTPGTAYTLTSTHNSYIAWYSTNEQTSFISGRGWADKTSLTSPENAHYLRFDYPTDAQDQVMLELGSTATAYAPYSNDCPISGWTGVHGGVCGKNLLRWRDNPSLPRTQNGITYEDAGDGQIKVSGTATGLNFFNIMTAGLDSDLYPLKPGGTYFFSAGSDNNSVRMELFVDGVSVRNAASFSYTMPTTFNSWYVRLRCTNTAEFLTPVIAQPFICLESEPRKVYEPYKGDLFSINWQTEAGTVYGGTVNPIGGALADECSYVDLSTLNWTYSSVTNRFTSSSLENVIKKPTTSEVLKNLLCSIYKTVSSSQLQDSDFCISASSGGNVFVKDSRYTDVASFVSAVANVDTIYPLAQPIEYQLTPQQLTALYGTNNVWSDISDDITVKYWNRGFGN